MSMTMLVLIAREPQPTTAENIAAAKEVILNNRRITIRELMLMMFTYRSSHSKKFLRMF